MFIFILFAQFFIFSLHSEFAYRPTSEPFVSGDSFRAICHFCLYRDYTPMQKNTNQTLSFDPRQVNYADLIFVDSDCLEDFFNNYHPLISHKYILITHNHDHGIPGKYINFLNDNKLLRWYGQNVEVEHSKLTPIPIGISNKHWAHSSSHDANLKFFIFHKKKNQKNSIKKKLLYFYFDVNTYPKERIFVRDLFLKKGYEFGKKLGFKEYLNSMSIHKFVLSPRGNGLDCHRTWEALYMGSIPIVYKSGMDSVFNDLPVLIIDNWNDVNNEYLERMFLEFSSKKYNFDKLYFDYWKRLIFKERESILKQLI